MSEQVCVKICAECYYHVIRREPKGDPDKCTHPRCREPVRGDPTLCYVNRLLPELCGQEGRYWEPKESVNSGTEEK